MPTASTPIGRSTKQRRVLVRPTRGKPATDLAVVARTWVWCEAVLPVVPFTDAEIDRLLVGKSESGKRRRLVESMKSLGIDPKVLRYNLVNQSIFHRFHSCDAFLPFAEKLEPAKADFESRFWDILTNPHMELEDFQQISAQIVEKRGWYRGNADDDELGFYASDWPDPAFLCHDENVFSAMLYHLERHPSADSVALLAALYKEAIAVQRFRQAALLEDALFACARLWIDKEPLHPDERSSTSHLIERLLEKRVVRGEWDVPRPPKEGTPRTRLRCVIDQYLEPLPDRPFWPIVQRSPLIDFINAHRATLSQIARLYAALNRQWGDSSGLAPLSDRRPARQALERAKASLPEAPPTSYRYCLPLPADFNVPAPGRASPYREDGTLPVPEFGKPHSSD